jgi:glutaredoxin-like protein
MTETVVTIFGCWWCGDCTWVRHYFDKNQIPYHWVDIDNDKSGEEFVLSTNHGMRSVPTLAFSDGSVLVEPTVAELKARLSSI